MKTKTLHFGFMLVALSALLMPVNVVAFDFEQGGIYYNILDSANVEVTRNDNNIYSGHVSVPGMVTHNGTLYQVTSIGEFAFYYCPELTGVDIPDAVTSIGMCAFNYCDLLGNVNLPSSLVSIGSGAFGRCPAMTSVFIPKSVTSIGQGAFSQCPGLESIQVETGNATYGSGSTNTIIYRPTHLLVAGCKNSVITSNVWYIGDHAFNGCEGLTELNLPSSIKSIGDFAFDRCRGLTSVDLPASVYYIGACAFENCMNMEHFSTEAEYIGQGAFGACHKLTEVNLGHSLTWIDRDAFDWCDALTTIDLPESLKKIGSDAFRDCAALTTVICRATTPPTAAGAFNPGFLGEIYDQVTLYVPRESIDAYSVADEWSKLSSIQPIVIGAGAGDVDGDGVIAIKDVTDLIDGILNGDEMSHNADLNGDGKVTIADITVLIDTLLSQQ